MGKIHRIKKHFWRVVAPESLPPRGSIKSYNLADTGAVIYVGRRRDDSVYVGHYSSPRSYDGLLNQLINAYEGGDSS